MAKLKFTTLFPGPVDVPTGRLYEAPFALSDHNKTSALFVCQDWMDYNGIELQGTGFRYKQGELVAGEITAITFQNGEGDAFMTIENVKLDAKNLPRYDENFDENLYNKAMRGDDMLIGTKNAEWMFGGNGNDTMIGGNGQDLFDGGKGSDTYTGKAGMDYFFTGPGMGKDVVTDFDAIKEGNDTFSQDYFTTRGGEYTIHGQNRGHDTVIDFGDGDMLILLGVKPRDVDFSDFNV